MARTVNHFKRRPNTSRGNQSYDINARVRRLLAKRGRTIAMLGGTAVDSMTVAGLHNITSFEPNKALRMAMLTEIHRQMVTYPRNWTIVHGLLSFDEDGEVQIDSRAWHIENKAAGELDELTTQQTRERYNTEGIANVTRGHAWIIVPETIPLAEAENLWDEFDEHFEKAKFFDRDYIENRRLELRLAASLENKTVVEDSLEQEKEKCITEQSCE